MQPELFPQLSVHIYIYTHIELRGNTCDQIRIQSLPPVHIKDRLFETMADVRDETTYD